MIVGLGIDLVETARIRHALDRFADRFCSRLLHPDEAALLSSRQAARLTEWVSGRFAAKEAALKALGTGLAAGINLHDIRILPDALGRPLLYLHGPARKRMELLGAAGALLSLTHTATTAAAVVILENRL
ncbi:MAG: holo-ACP synthase [Desulfovibrio sp.]|jgi:holo-[acyl-carrier protein] synthase|nr:holo-ACP synthase [Desulfovibrio sp.]